MSRPGGADIVTDRPSLVLRQCHVRQIRQDNTTEEGQILLDVPRFGSGADQRVALAIEPSLVDTFRVGQSFTLVLYEE